FDGELTRTHPFVTGLAGWVLDGALDPHGASVARRCGVVRTADVSRRTTLLLLRHRFHLVVTVRGEQRPLLAEDCSLVAFQGPADDPVWLDTEATERLLAARPAANVSPGEAAHFLRQVMGRMDALRPWLEAEALPPGERLNEAISRSWNRLVAAWATFRDALARLPEGAPATTETRERWLLVLIGELGFGRLQPARGLEMDGRAYPVSHLWGAVPIHLVGAGVSLDRRTPGQAGAARTSPHGLVQELLNASDEHLW